MANPTAAPETDPRPLEERLRLPPEPGAFGDAELQGLPAPVARYFRASVAPGAPLTRAAVLRMRGRLRLGSRWLPFRGREVLAPQAGLVWSARVAGVMAGSDRAAPGLGSMDWKLLGLLRVAQADGDDVARSAAGRVAGEATWVPTALLPRYGVRWEAPSDHDLVATLVLGAVATAIQLRIDDRGLPRWVRFDRWGDPDGTGDWRLRPFGFEVGTMRRFGPFTVPAEGTAGWYPGGDGWEEGAFFRCSIDDLEPVG